MSTDSSSDKLKSAKPLDGWLATPVGILCSVAIFFVAPAIAVNILALYKHSYTVNQLQDWLSVSIEAQFFYTLIAEVLVVAAVLGLIRLFKWSRSSIGLVRPKWYQPLLGIATAVPYFFCFIVISTIIGHLVPGFNLNQTQQTGFNHASTNVQLTLAFFSLVVLPPIAEEILFRGFLFTAFKKWLPTILSGLLVCILFAMPHLGESASGWHSLTGLLWIAGLDTFILSIFLVSLRQYTGNLWGGVALHATKNLVGFVFLFHLIG